jgi:hypothetical protein
MSTYVYVDMVSNKQRTIALSTVAITAVIVLFATGPLAATQAHAFWGGGFHRHFGGFGFGHRFFGGFGFPGWGWGGGCGGCGGCGCGGW